MTAATDPELWEWAATVDAARVFTDYADAHPQATALEAAHAVLSDLPDEMVRRFAAQYGVDLIEAHQRAQVRAVERAAVQVRPLAQPGDEARFQAIFDQGAPHVGNARQRRAFRRWCGDRFDGWHQRAQANAGAAGPDDAELFAGDWHPAGVRGYARERNRQRVRDLIDEVAAEVRIETTAELLSSVFALGDGTDVAWGEATVADHQQRIEVLARNAAGNVETAAVHRAAIRMITAAGATCLREIGGAA